MFKYQVQNFKAIKSAEMEVEGFTAIVGPSSAGKSWLLRSIFYALTNKGGAHFTTGTNKLQVDLFFPQEGDIQQLLYTWKKARVTKKSSSASITVNGTELSKVGHQAINLDEYGFREIKLKTAKYYLNYWAQFDKPFLVYESPQTVFDLFNKLFENDKIMAVHKNLSIDTRSIKADVDADLLTKQSLENTIKKQTTFFQTIGADYTAFKELKNAIFKNQAMQEGIREYLTNKELIEAADKVSELYGAGDPLDGIRDIIFYDAVAKEAIVLCRSLAYARTAEKEISGLMTQVEKANVAVLANINAPRALGTYITSANQTFLSNNIHSIYGSLDGSMGYVKQFEAASIGLSKAVRNISLDVRCTNAGICFEKAHEAVFKTQMAERLSLRIHDVANQSAKAATAKIIDDNFNAINTDLQETKRLTQCSGVVSTALNQGETLRTLTLQERDITLMLQQMEENKKAMEADLGVCPTCQRPF